MGFLKTSKKYLFISGFVRFWNVGASSSLPCLDLSELFFCQRGRGPQPLYEDNPLQIFSTYNYISSFLILALDENSAKNCCFCAILFAIYKAPYRYNFILDSWPICSSARVMPVFTTDTAEVISVYVHSTAMIQYY